ncbi:unnamed protein product [Heterobilharzia americana]|nr:unnamed protein product [Heterobilharzia americana]CAH8564020.1 unnamed protein product [Heterobilharzia americana]
MVSVGLITARLSDLQDNITKLSHELEVKRKESDSQKNIVKKLDAEIKDKHRFLDSLEQKSEKQKEAIKANFERLCELQKSATECQKAHESLEKRLESQEEAIRCLENEVSEAQSQAKVSAQIYDEALKQLQDKLDIVEKCEKEEESLLKTIKELKDEANTHGNKLRRMDVQQLEGDKRIERLENFIKDLSEQIVSATQRAVEAERESERLGTELTFLEVSNQ